MRKADNYHHPVPLSRNLGTLTSWNLLGLSRPVTGLIYLFFYQVMYGISRPATRTVFVHNVFIMFHSMNAKNLLRDLFLWH